MALRVSQIDALRLDDEIESVLEEELKSLCKAVGIPTENWLLELKALASLVVFSSIFLPQRQTYGQTLLNLKYSSNWVRATQLYALGRVLIPLVWARLKLRIGGESNRTNWNTSDTAHHPRTPAQRFARFVEKYFKVLTCLNFLFFLRSGRYVHVLQRVFDITMISTRQSPRVVNLDFLNRELLWHGFSEFIAFLLPVINRIQLQRIVGRLLPTAANADTSVCGLCGEEPWTAHAAPCGHVFCYYCAASNCLATDGFDCPRCGKAVALAQLARVPPPPPPPPPTLGD
eukprot:m.55510 g.55510  ORF g.55510 m.55510 type:complete len:287 (+) comp11968_c0_seq2:30-890(+)